jgi:hypothetical protein
MSKISTVTTALWALSLALYASAQSTITIWLPIPQDDVPLPTLTVLKPDWTLLHTNVKDFKVDGNYVTEMPVGDLDFAKAGELLFDGSSDTMHFWIRKGDKDSPTRDMTKVSRRILLRC